jgi:hypothetical protein
VAAGETDYQLQVQLDWSAAADVDAKIATQFLVQIGVPAGGRPDGIHLIVGHANPPVIVGDDEKTRQAQVERLEGKLPVIVHGRYVISRARLEELRNVLDDLAEKYDALDATGEQS